MRNRLFSAPLNTESEPVLQWIEVASSIQIPSFHLIGLPSPEVAEARERVRAAIEASGFEFPRRRVVLNLSPASIRKRGTGLDLAMALAVLQSSQSLDDQGLAGGPWAAWGELGLDGSVKPAFQLTRTLYACWSGGVPALLLSEQELGNARTCLDWLLESRELPGEPPRLIPVRDLRDAWERIHDGTGRESEVAEPSFASAAASAPLPGREGLLPLPPPLERLIGISAAGAHHVLLLGPKGTGKSHALEWLMALQPLASAASRVRAALLAELGNPQWAIGKELLPVRRIGAQVRPAALLGSATEARIRPGEFSRAHGGILIADEFPEWPRDAREALREPLERGRVILTRAQGSVEFPTDFVFAANGNLCPCGGWPTSLPIPPGDGPRPSPCHCPPRIRKSYLSRLSGPVMDRIDILYLCAALPPVYSDRANRDRLRALRERTERAREASYERWGEPGRLAAAELELLLAEHPRWRTDLDALRLASLRSRHKVLRVALSIAHWDGKDEPDLPCFAEASYYRPERSSLFSSELVSS